MQSYEKQAGARSLVEARLTQFCQRPAHPTEEAEVDLQELYENNNYYKALDPEDFASDRGWQYRCRHCDLNTRVHTKAPRCRHCGFTQQH